MKILILTEVFFPDTIGGAGKYVYYLARELAEKGHKVSLITPRIKDLPSEQVVEAITVFRVSRHSIRNPLKLFLFLKEILEIFKRLSAQGKFDLIVFNQPFSALPIVFSRESKEIPKIYNFLSSWADEFEIKSFLKHKPYLPNVILKRIILSPIMLLMRMIERAVIFRSDKVVTLSRYTRERLQRLYAVPSEKIMMIPFGVDTKKFKPTDMREKNIFRAELGISDDSFVLFTARNLVPRMGLDNLILALRFLVKQNAKIKLMIAGEGFLENRLKALAKRLSLSEDNIKFLGALAEENLVKYYQASDLFVLPTKFLEGFGIATIEALACGLPALGTPVGGTIEILSKFDKNLLFSNADPESISEKILEFIENTQDKELLSKRCRQFILENYSLERFSDEIEKFYLSVAKKNG